MARRAWGAWVVVGWFAAMSASVGAGPLDPRGKVHIPIGVANTLDALKTFVEPEGCFSPGLATYGVYFWATDPATGKLIAPTMDGVPCEHGLGPGGALVPWSRWSPGGGVTIRTEVCEVARPSGAGTVFVVGARAEIRNESGEPRRLSFFVVLRDLGPAGGPVYDIHARGGLHVNGHPAVLPDAAPDDAGVAFEDVVVQIVSEQRRAPRGNDVSSPSGNGCGALQYNLALAPGESKRLGFVCPVLVGRRAVGHRWDGTSEWAQLDLAKPNPDEGGQLQPDPGLDYYRKLSVDTLFAEAEAYWKNLTGRATVRAPDARWGEAFAAIAGHAAVAMNEGAPDVAVVNYNVFNRDGVYTTSILHKVGQFELAAQCIDYFLDHPFNGRVYPEADNPGQVLWIMAEHWRFTRDRDWLARVYPSARKLAAMVRYYRTTPGPHWVNANRLDFGDDLPPDQRQKLEPGRCDGHHPEYTEAFDVAGLRAAAELAKAAGRDADAAEWSALAEKLFDAYDRRFGGDLRKSYGSYCVLWPCRLYPLDQGKAHEQFKGVGKQKPESWRYFPLATAHQGLLAGNRAAAHETIALHLAHEQMAGGERAGRGWYAFDEGGKSGPGGWHHLRTTWNKDVAMPHGWAVAELHLLIRDSLLFEDGDRLVLLAGVPADWFRRGEGVEVTRLPTHFGAASFRLTPHDNGATLTLSGDARPPGGFVLRLPDGTCASASAGGRAITITDAGDLLVPAGTQRVEIAFTSTAP